MLSSIGGFIYLIIAVPAVAWDLTTRRIPDWLTVGGAAILAGARVVGMAGPVAAWQVAGPVAAGPVAAALSVLEGCFIAAGLFYALWYLTRGGIGRGDGKYALQLGALLPSGHVAPAVLAAFAGALAVAALFRNALALPFSPFLVFGAVLLSVLARLGLV